MAQNRRESRRRQESAPRAYRERGYEEQRRRQQKRRRRQKARVRRLKRLIFCTLFLVLGVCAVRLGMRWKGGLGKSKKSADLEKLAEEGYPESLLKLLEKNPEAEQFVLDYPKNKDKHVEIDISKEVKEGEIPLFIQWDERWGYETYGEDFLALTGCGPTSLSMVRCGLSGDGDWDPYRVARVADGEGYYVNGAGSSWNLMTDGAEKLGLKAEEVPFDAEHICAELEAGHPIICVVGPGDFTDSGHFLVLTGVDDQGHIILNDPNSRIRSRQTWDLDQLMLQIKNLWSYSYSGE